MSFSYILLRLIGRAGVGVDNIDLEAATSAESSFVARVLPQSVVELTIGHLLASARYIPTADRFAEWRMDEKIS